MNWTTNDIPSQAGRFAIVTGANSGLGYETALALAGAGAEVVLASRDETKGKAAVEKILSHHPNAKATLELLDLASLDSVRQFAERIASQRQSIDLLINNAGVMALPKRMTTRDGFEMQLGTNFLGHFALTAHLLPLLKKGQSPRVVQLASVAHRGGTIHLDDLQLEKKYTPFGAYCQSKLAMLMFGIEMQRRSEAAQWRVMSNSAHPGWARTNLFTSGPRGLFWKMSEVFAPVFAQSAAAGALPILYAATSPDALGGAYYGPTSFGELTGPPGPAGISAAAKDLVTAARLWDAAENLTGLHFV